MWEYSYLSISCLHKMCRNDRQHPILLSQNHSFERWHLNRYGRLMFTLSGHVNKGLKIVKKENRWSKVLPVSVSCICIILGNFMEKITLPSGSEHLFTYPPHYHLLRSIRTISTYFGTVKWLIDEPRPDSTLAIFC